MQLYNGIITLDYNPTTDILQTSMPDVKQFSLSEVSFCLELIIDNIRNFDIKHLLLDSSHSVVEVDNESYKAITTKFAVDLRSTRLRKIARVGTADSKREEKTAKLSSELKQELHLPVEFRNFSNKPDALSWLLTSGKA